MYAMSVKHALFAPLVICHPLERLFDRRFLFSKIR